jgi:lipopolysaccharide transport protein LptA
MIINRLIIAYLLTLLFVYNHNVIASDEVVGNAIPKTKPIDKGEFNNSLNAPDIYVNSDNLSVDQTKNIVNFEGKVILWFDDMVLKTDRIEIIYKKIANKKEIDKVIIPNKLIAIRTIEQEVLIADSAEYLTATNELILIGNVKLQHKDDIVKTEKFIYHTKLKEVSK